MNQRHGQSHIPKLDGIATLFFQELHSSFHRGQYSFRISRPKRQCYFEALSISDKKHGDAKNSHERILQAWQKQKRYQECRVIRVCEFGIEAPAR